MSGFQHHHPKKEIIPETIVGQEGTAKRNILRRGGASKGGRKENAANSVVDDGSTFVDALDEHDPNYDSEEGGDEFVTPSLLRSAVGGSSMTLTAYKKVVEPLISEYFVHGDVAELFRGLQDIGAPEYSYEFVKRAINMSFDKGDRERELISQVLSNGYPDMFSSSMIGKGFERLFELIDDYAVDAPAAKTMLATFLTRAVVDEVLPPSFLADAVVCNLGGEVVVQAKTLLSLHHGGAKLEKIWGPGDGRSVEELKIALDQLLQEYILSGDLEEAARCIFELNSPQFYHEVVKRTVVNSLDLSVEKQASMSELLAFLIERDQLTGLQAKKGFDRLHSLLPDLELDTPSARTVLAEFVARAKVDGVLPESYQYVEGSVSASQSPADPLKVRPASPGATTA